MNGYAQMSSAVGMGPIEDLISRGIAFASGRKGRVDLVEAHKWFNLAAVGGDSDAVRRREEIASEMSRDEIAEALRAARTWLSAN